MLLNPTIAPAYTKSSTDKPTKEKPVSCGLKAPSNKRSLNKKEETQISSIITEVESLESKGLYEQAANQYFDAQKIIMDAEGSCSVNSGRFRLVYGSKLYRAFRLEEAEEQIKKGLEILQLHSVGTRETCEEFNGGIEFLDEIYTKKQDFVSLSDIFFKKWPFLKKCLETQGEVTKPALFNIFIRLSGAFFSGYVQEDNEALRSKRAELAFDSLNKAYSVVGGKPTQMQLADILLKEGYFKYSMAGVSKNNKRSDLLLRARRQPLKPCAYTLGLMSWSALKDLQSSWPTYLNRLEIIHKPIKSTETLSPEPWINHLGRPVLAKTTRFCPDMQCLPRIGITKYTLERHCSC